MIAGPPVKGDERWLVGRVRMGEQGPPPVSGA
jgi:hypothetical protein